MVLQCQAMRMYLFNMDKSLKDRGVKISRQIDILKPAHEEYLFFKAHEEVMWAKIYLQSNGKNVAEKEAQTYASQEWQDFLKGKIQSEARYYDELRKYELYKMAWQSEYGSLKYDTDAIKRGVS